MPLALVVIFVSLITWPLVLKNGAPRLLAIAYIAAAPVVPLLWRSTRASLIVAAMVIGLAVQVAAFGAINFWFDGL